MLLILLVLRKIRPTLLKQQKNSSLQHCKAPTTQIGRYFLIKICKPRSENLAQYFSNAVQQHKRELLKLPRFERLQRYLQLWTLRAPWSSRSCSCFQQAKDNADWAKTALQIQAKLVLTDLSANGKNCCKAKSGLSFHPLLGFSKPWFLMEIFLLSDSGRSWVSCKFFDYPDLQACPKERLPWV